MGILKIKKHNNVVDVQSVYRPKTKVGFYKMSIRCYEDCFSLADEYLTEKELLFVVSCAIVISTGTRKLYSNSSLKIFDEVSGLPNARVVRNYLSNPKVKKWVVKTKEGYILIPYLEKLIESDTTNFNITIVHDYKED
jgi:hypothetical protein